METSQALKALAALAQESRLTIFRMLVEAGPGGLPAGEIASRLKLPAATASFHLAQLAQGELIQSRSEGRFIYYSVDFSRMAALIDFLTEDCCGGKACAPAPQPITLVNR